MQLLPDRDKLPVTRSHPYACPRCSKRMSDLHGRKIRVFHGELPDNMQLWSLDWHLRLMGCTKLCDGQYATVHVKLCSLPRS